MIPNECIIIGGGWSIKEGLSKGLKDKIRNKFSIGLNFSYRYFDSTILSFVDHKFYKGEEKGLTAEQLKFHLKSIKNHPLIIGNKHAINTPHPNTILLPTISEYRKNVKEGCYSNSLAGLFALSLAIYLIDKGTVFILGFDFGNFNNKRDKNNKLITHFYNDIKHRGSGRVNWYSSENKAKRFFEVYNQDKDIKIYNVSLNSKIPNEIFSKISYDVFFSKLNKETYSQYQIRNDIKDKLK